jgi:NADH-quinone oxidoreductase subunit N
MPNTESNLNLSPQWLSVIAPEIVLSVFALAVLLMGTMLRREQRAWLNTLSLVGIVCAAGASWWLWDKAASLMQPRALLGFDAKATLIADGYAQFFNLIFLVGAALAILMSDEFLRQDRDRLTLTGEYYALILLATVGMMIMAATNDLLVFFLGLETLSLALYVLAGFARTKVFSLEAAVKYFLLGSFATGFLLYGIALIYGVARSTNLRDIAQAVEQLVTTGGEMTLLLYAGIGLLLIGFAFKAALVPFHQWTPDVYEGAPTPVTGFMAVGAKAAAFAAVLRVFNVAFSQPEVARHWTAAVWVIAVLTMTVGNVAAIAQTSLKRMLAYSSIAHAGYLLIGVLSSKPDHSGSVLFYLMSYAFMNLGAFSWVALLSKRDSGDLTLEDCNGVATRYPLAAAVMALFMFSLAGIPPLAGFWAKWYVFRDGVEYYMTKADVRLLWLVIIGALNSVIAVFYYLRVVVRMYMQEPSERAAARGPMAFQTAFASALCALAVLALGLLPGSVWEMAVNSLIR